MTDRLTLTGVDMVKRKTNTEVVKEFAKEQGLEVTDMGVSSIEEEQASVVPLTPQEQAQALRDYVASMQKTQGHTSAELRDIVETIHRRMILVVNYSGADLAAVKSIKTQMKSIVEDELERYKDEC